MRTPWFRCDARIGEDPRVARLRTDSARWAWVLTLGKGKEQRPQGLFPSESHLVAALGKYGKYVPELIAVGLVEHSSEDAVRIRAWPVWQTDLDYSTPRVVQFRAERARRKALKEANGTK